METSTPVITDDPVDLMEGIDNKGSVIKYDEEGNSTKLETVKGHGIRIPEETSHSEDVMQTFDEFKNSQGSSLNQSYEEVSQRLLLFYTFTVNYVLKHISTPGEANIKGNKTSISRYCDFSE